MQGSTAAPTKSNPITVSRILLLCAIVAFLQTFLLKHEMTISLFYGTLSGFLNMAIIVFLIGYPIKWIFKTQKGFLFALAVALAYDLFFVVLIMKH